MFSPILMYIFLYFLLTDAPKFLEDACYTKNCMAYLKWQPPECAVDEYLLEVRSPTFSRNDFVLVYTGHHCEYTVERLLYGSVIYGRVRAKNSSGEGVYSQELKLKVPEGK